MIKMFRTDKKLYQDYCPMYDQGKSGYWISEIKGIQNPVLRVRNVDLWRNCKEL
jgi:hypothetical protein